jgi:hypothetical protein
MSTHANERHTHLFDSTRRKGPPVTAPDLLTVDHDSGSLPFDWSNPPDDPTQWPIACTLRLVDEDDFGSAISIELRVPLSTSGIGRLARAVAEVGFGLRPASHLHRWVARTPLDFLHAHGAAVRRHPSNVGRDTRRWQQVRGIRIQPVNDITAETSAVLIGSRRACAVAMRMELIGQQWLATAVRLA